jgi:hypothetical protein
MNKWGIFFIIVIGGFTIACSLLVDQITINNGDNIRFVFDAGLNEDSRFRLEQDFNGFYILNLSNHISSNQTIQRISVRLLDGDLVVYSKSSGNKHQITWESNLFWWIMEGDTVASITRTYFNPFTGVLQYVNLPPLVNWQDELVPTINSVSVTNENSGRASTVIAPIKEMVGDTMTVTVTYRHEITEQKRGSSFYNVIGHKDISELVRIILK